MRLIFLPWELNPLSLLALEGIADPFRLGLIELEHAIALKDPLALAQAERLVLRATHQAPETRGAIGVFYASVLWQTGRWLDAMEIIRQARNTLSFSVLPEAFYHGALATYLDGLIALSLHADEKAVNSFHEAQTALEEAARYWGYGRDRERMQACHDLVRWMSELQNGMTQSQQSDAVFYFLPLFEEIQGIFQRVGLFVLPSSHLTLSEGTLARVYTAGSLELIPLSAWSVPLLPPVLDTYYCARRIVADGDGVALARRGDIPLLECNRLLPVEEHGVFIRQQHDGRILFRAQVAGRGLNCVAKALLRQGGEL